MTNATQTSELLLGTLQAAAEVAQTRTGVPVGVTQSQQPEAQALLRFDVKFGTAGALSWFVSNHDATGFSDLLIGGTGNRDAELTEMHLDALSGVFSDMLDRAVGMLSAAIGPALPEGGVDMGMEGALPDVAAGGERIVAALDVSGLGPITVVVQVDAPLASLIAAAQPAAPGTADAAAAPAGEPGSAEPVAHGAAFGAAGPAGTPGTVDAAGYDNVVQLPNLTSSTPTQSESDLRMLLNVPLPVTVELGKTERTVRDLLNMNVGSILELNKLAGDPMDIMVNGKVLARGEVVVIDEEFGIRITEILSPEQRLRNLG